MHKGDHVFISTSGMNVLKGNSLFDKPDAVVTILKAIKHAQDQSSLLSALSRDPTIQRLGGARNCLNQLQELGFIITEKKTAARTAPIDPIQETEDIKRLKRRLVALIEKTNHPDIWNFFLNVEAAEERNGLIWVLNEIIKQIDPQIDESLKKQYQEIFQETLELR